MEINELVRMAYENAVNHGFYEGDNQNIPEKLMLIVTEISEACEADRKNRHCNEYYIKQCIKCGEFYSLSDFEAKIKDTFEDELADAVIRIADLAGYCGIDLDAHIQAKMLYNKNRPYKHGKRY